VSGGQDGIEHGQGGWLGKGVDRRVSLVAATPQACAHDKQKFILRK
jgi:hypothetical protein